ncbi:LapA family protein [Mycobacterium sp.]|uniref:LapA family protein n=1 Tax=Mycobacterium sp. TaxID=1785 RepID=UPI003D0D4ECE
MSSDPSVSPEEPPVLPASSPGRVPPPESAVKFTRTAGLWSFLALGFFILIVLLIFITQNTSPGDFAFLGWHWTLPLGVAILLAAVSGGLITFLAGTARIYQLRRAAKKNLVAGR